jgi:hypothetical protein
MDTGAWEVLYDNLNTCAVFTTNRDVPLDMVQGFTDQYTQRWQIENEYKTIKQHFLPTVASTDYRIRFLYFVIGVIMYNDSMKILV